MNMSHPKMCYIYVESSMGIGIVIWGEAGYYISNYDGKTQENIKLVDKLNTQLGVSESEAEVMKILSKDSSIDKNIEEWQKKFDDIIKQMNNKICKKR